MGNFFSTLSDTNPSSPNSTTTIPNTMSSSSESSPTHESKSDLEPTQESNSEVEPTRQPETTETQNPKEEIKAETQEENGDKEKDINLDEEEEEEGECGFCLFMKGGGCKDEFVDWEKCIEEGEKNKEDIVEKCFEVTSALKKCMEAHSDYYAPILQAEKAAEAELEKELDKEKEKEEQRSDADASGSVSVDPTLDGNSNSS